MKDLVQNLSNEYLKWLKERITFKQIDNYIEITTPFLDRHNDWIQIYAVPEGNKMILNDDGYTIRDLEISGINISGSKKRKELLNITLNGLGVNLDQNNRLNIDCTEYDFPQKKHSLIQAIISVNDMFYLSSSHTSSLFFEDVFSWFNINHIRGIEKMGAIGKSGFFHIIDYSISSSEHNKERLIKIVSSPSKSSINNTLFVFSDIKNVRKNFIPTVILNDDQEIKPNLLSAFQNYEIESINWSERDNYVSKLCA